MKRSVKITLCEFEILFFFFSPPAFPPCRFAGRLLEPFQAAFGREAGYTPVRVASSSQCPIWAVGRSVPYWRVPRQCSARCPGTSPATSKPCQLFSATGAQTKNPPPLSQYPTDWATTAPNLHFVAWTMYLTHFVVLCKTCSFVDVSCSSWSGLHTQQQGSWPTSP